MLSSATRDEIRVAYRRLARQHHPDAKGDGSAVRMAQINEAWRVLSDPARRATYDAASRGSSAQRAQAAPMPATGSGTGPGTVVRPFRAPSQVEATPARFPWRFMLLIGAAGVAFILINAALTKPSPAEVPDNLITSGSCVHIADNGDAVEAACDGTNDGVVVSLISTDSLCPQDTESHRDHQGMGQVCVRMATANG